MLQQPPTKDHLLNWLMLIWGICMAAFLMLSVLLLAYGTEAIDNVFIKSAYLTSLVVTAFGIITYSINLCIVKEMQYKSSKDAA